jgi:adenine-specific DNA-methyltransferase
VAERRYHQALPSAGPERESLRQKGQFWTPDWVADAMVGYVLKRSSAIFDPAVGTGVFFRAAKRVGAELGHTVRLSGTEVDPEILKQARDEGLSDEEVAQVQIADFVLNPPDIHLPAIVANPPYIRHHRLSAGTKARLKRLGQSLLGQSLDGRAGLHIYFLIRALQRSEPNGRLAFIMPADTCEGVFAAPLWEWITRNYCLDAVITFTPDATPFPGVDTNPLIFLLRNAPPQAEHWWVRCTQPWVNDLKDWVLSDFGEQGSALEIHRRATAEALSTGLSREPYEEALSNPTLSMFATTMRGIATGANDFFFLTHKQAKELRIPDEWLLPAVGRTRDVPGEEITSNLLDKLDAMGRPTLLFSPDKRPLTEFPRSVREYLEHGSELGLPSHALISQRTPWYKMEVREPPPFLFAYLGRRNTRFIRNTAGVMPLTGFLCVYPKRNDSEFVEKLWCVLNHPATIANLSLVGKSYGAGAIKVEPRALENLPIPASILSEVGLPYTMELQQLRLFDKAKANSHYKPKPNSKTSGEGTESQ